MPKAQPVLRNATGTDIPAIREIYADQVLNGVSSWEEIPPDNEEMKSRYASIVAAGYPYRVVEIKGDIAGYSYASSYRPRIGYRYTVENTIYIDKNYRGQGLGRLLMEDLVACCEARGFRQMVAVIGDSNNHVSIDFHTRMGFVPAGVIRSIGFKYGRWMDSVIMQRALAEGDESLPD